MRRKHCEIKDVGKIEGMLSSVNIGRLATMGADGFPYITPVNFVYRKGRIYFHCAPEGEKLEHRRAIPQPLRLWGLIRG